YDTRAASLAVGDGFAGGSAGWRLVAQQYLSDGFRDDAYLSENSTNGYDEGSINNTYTTYSNQPGPDAQLSNGAALRLVDTIDGVGELRSVTSAANSKITYSF